ncbi:MAG: hypothetical protein COW87_03165 [Candidatus Levybacteria bacterium CG22_combo_CG10-13_8_21_14_all_35_11]|nr:MAG: hypothetical protein COW87_03165 [Candidatus Levybacteria bacterium CG22_combo_CG10-13_8_21_14_all_35_11]
MLFSSDKKPLENIVKKIHKNLRKNVKKLSGGVLHAVKEKPITRKRLLKLLVGKEVVIMTIFLNKSKVYTHLQDEKHVLYNYVTNILLDRIMTKHLGKDKEIILIAAKRETNKFLNLGFKDYLENQLKNKHKALITIEIKMPSEEKALQAVDFASWSIFRKYEHGDDSYYKLIKKIIIEESPLFP